MDHPPVWNPYEDWKDRKVDWVRVDISKEDLKRFTTKNDFKGFIQAVSFLLFFVLTAGWAYWSFANGYWVMMAVALYVHGGFYSHFGHGIHELTHNTVFKNRNLTKFFTTIYGLLYWTYNPYFYRLSHQTYHHRYTLHQGSDGEDVPNYIELNFKQWLILFFNVLHVKTMIQNLGRLFTLKPTSYPWRGRGYKLDLWENFILERASEKQRKQIYGFALYSLIFHVVFAAVCIITGFWFLPILITLAPFYGPSVHGFICGIHQHVACEANHPDFRISCGHTKLNPLSSFLYWHMEYHIEHHMYAGIPCYNLKKFYEFVKDQMPPLEPAVPRLFKMNELCKEKYGSWVYWRDNFGRFKGFDLSAKGSYKK